MSTIIRSLIISSSLIANLIHPASLDSFDTNLLTPYVERAQHAFEVAHETIQWLDHGPHDILVTGKSIAKKLYSAQKAILKCIKNELKYASQPQKDINPNPHSQTHQLYKAFKHLVYKPWKKRVKARYQESKKSDDPHVWGWIHHQKLVIENS